MRNFRIFVIIAILHFMNEGESRRSTWKQFILMRTRPKNNIV